MFWQAGQKLERKKSWLSAMRKSGEEVIDLSDCEDINADQSSAKAEENWISGEQNEILWVTFFHHILQCLTNVFTNKDIMVVGTNYMGGLTAWNFSYQCRPG